MVAQNIFFGILAAIVAISALRMVTTRNIVHAALYLVAVLAGLGALYVLLTAEFVATTQVLVYIGAVMVLFLFGIMLTKAPLGNVMEMTGRQWPLAAVVAALLGGVTIYSLVDRFGSERLNTDGPIYRTADVSDEVFSTYIVPFEAVSVLLLAALIGAIVLARKD
ncbi:MAG TPA: proton-conducting membrane transporter [Acidimicrobiaceae bacterium]|jgi:NADH-quinone oxidoreductase subunit J|nr:proton-conducting membrane transporter [Acidimicrobiaceae bacterium]MBR81238.1 proton-conducting membrane transporter [Acidimicrobiaceae bacterium]MEC7427689.1 NADH-quinone oxidoreductase subunit J [Actinomycetota bacterium]HAQ44368.1 proton-conducting membrane transporter [Acidimicrobiaceae bacterium]HBU40771.1 proton-conducting membrane transporter [Acidimicrobiaceae bacterium]|tara:strand:- start:573 stop:1067 length:495 start_codon:yes stop_codon:yes gene_type:complete